MRNEQTRTQERSAPAAWADGPDGPPAKSAAASTVVLEAVDARAGGTTIRRVFRGRLRNLGDAPAVVTMEVALPAPFLPSAPVLMQRLFTIMPGETLRVELGSTVGAAPSVDEVRRAARLRVA